MNPATRATEFHLKIFPKDFAKVRMFYEELLSFPVTNQRDRGEDDKGVMFDTGSGIIELLTPEEIYVPVRGCNVFLEVADVRALWEKLKDAAPVVFSLRDNALDILLFVLLILRDLESRFLQKICRVKKTKGRSAIANLPRGVPFYDSLSPLPVSCLTARRTRNPSIA